MVREFHEHIGAEIAINPRLLPCNAEAARDEALAMLLLSLDMKQKAIENDDLLLKRLAMAIEETSEWLDAHAVGDLAKAADAWADRAYVLMGDAVAAGLPAAELFAEIHRSNMSKDAANDEDGKGQKREGYSAPDVGGVLRRPTTD